MTIKRIMLLLIAVLSVQLIVAQGRLFYVAYENLQMSARATASNKVVGALIKASALWAKERGVTNTALSNSEPASADTIQTIANLREGNTKAFHEAMDNADSAGLVVSDSYKQAITAALEKVNSLRSAIDAGLKLPQAQRDPAMQTNWLPAIISLIEKTQKLLINISSQGLSGEAVLGKQSMIRHSIWLMTEYAGRERALIGGSISSRNPISAEQMEQLHLFHGKVAEGWNVISNIALTPEEHALFDAPVQAVKDDYFGSFEKVREQMYEEGKTGDYSMTAPAWIDRSSQAIGTLLKLQDASTDSTDALLKTQTSSSDRGMVQYGLALCVSLAAVVAALWVVLRRVLRPIHTLSDSMLTIADGEFTQDVPYLTRSDEMGGMAKSVEVFRQNGLEKVKLEAHAKEAERAAQEQKKRAQIDLADRFESQVQGIITTVASAATELYQTAEGMSKAIAVSSTKAERVAGASGQASGNVQSVAAAAEEMTATVKEIASQLVKSSSAVKDTVQEVSRADGIAMALSEATYKIGEIVDVIQTIAGQINLLALNATIESARAGEAGKGFAVVASEVKNLATQTAKSTDQITEHVQSIQGVSKQVVEVLQAVKKSVANVDEYSAAISAAVEEQSATNNEISANMGKAATGTQQINIDIEEVSKASAEASSAAEQTLEAARMVSQEAEKLNKEVSLFLASVRNG